MKIEFLLVGFLISIHASQSLADDSDAFDALNGKYETLSSGALMPNTLISCNLSVDEAYFGSKWIPSVSIIFAGANESDEDGVTIKLSASRSSEDQDWRHQFMITGSEGRESVIAAYTGLSDSVLPMHLLWDDDGYIVFYVGELENMSMLDVSQYPLVKWQVTTSGVKGSGDCDSFLIGDDDE
jgi:hypothetical protein